MKPRITEIISTPTVVLLSLWATFQSDNVLYYSPITPIGFYMTYGQMDDCAIHSPKGQHEAPVPQHPKDALLG